MPTLSSACGLLWNMRPVYPVPLSITKSEQGCDRTNDGTASHQRWPCVIAAGAKDKIYFFLILTHGTELPYNRVTMSP
jgi:hypothetical protein